MNLMTEIICLLYLLQIDNSELQSINKHPHFSYMLKFLNL